MILFLRKLLLSFLLLSFGVAYSQQWMEMHKHVNVDLEDIRQDFNEYWVDRSVEKGKGFKQFKRWEYFIEDRLDENGSIPSGREIWEEIMLRQNTPKGDPVADWQHMGPVAIPVNGGAGRLNCMAFHPTDPNTMWVGSPSGGLWKTTNGGQSWSTNTDWLATLGVTEIVVHPKSPNIMYLATGDYDAGDTYSVGVLKSTDGGNSWNTTGMSFDLPAGRRISRLIMHPTDYDTLIASTSAGIFRSLNGGDSWAMVRNGNFSDVQFKPGNPDIVYGGSTGGFFKSINGGQSFALASTLGAAANYNRMQIAVTIADPEYVYIILSNAQNSGFGGLYRSTDSGDNFALRSNSPNILGWSSNGSDQGGQGWFDLAIAASPVNRNMIITGGVNIWRSITGGSTWSLAAHWRGQGAPYVHADIHGMYYSPHNNTTVFACTDGGLFRSTNNGGSWTDLSNGLAIGQMYRLGLSHTNSDLVITGWQDNGTNLRSGTSWAKVRGGDGMECIIDYTNPSIMYSSIYYGAISRSLNGGLNWTSITDNLQENGAWVTPYVMHSTNPQILYIGLVNLYKTTNRGNSWQKQSNFTDNTTIRALAVAESNPNVIYLSKLSALWKSTNDGTSWTNLTSNLPSGGAITYISVHPTNPSIVYITRGGFVNNNKVYRSNDGGNTWTNLSDNLPNLPVNCIVYEKGSDDGIYVGTDIGVYYRDNILGEWISFNDQLPNVIIKELEIHYPTRMIRAASYGRGLWESHLYSFNTSVEPLKNLSYQSLNVFPSPATDMIKVEIPSAKPSYTTIRVYAVDGSLMKTLHRDNISEVDINVSSFAAGAYYIDAYQGGIRYRTNFVKQ